MTDKKIALELDYPSFTCGACRFTSAVMGEWSVEDGRLVFRADMDPQPGRGPDLNRCCEGNECGDFARIETDWGHGCITDEGLAALRETASRAWDGMGPDGD